MRIVHAISSLGNGGAEKQVVELANEQSKTHEVIVISFRSVEPWMHPPKRISKAVRLITFEKKPGFDVKLLLSLIGVLRKLKPDVIHAHLNSTLRYIYAVSKILRKPSYIHTVHSNYCEEKIVLFKSLQKFPGFKETFVNVCIADTICRDFTAGFPAFRFTCVPNGIYPIKPDDELMAARQEVNNLQVHKDAKKLLTIGSFLRYKNLPGLVRVMKRVNAPKARAELFIIGEPNRKPVEVDVKELENPAVHLLGSKPTVANYLTDADALLVGSTVEGMPLVVLEAMSLGVPVVSTPVGGVPDMISDPENGFLADSMDESALESALERFLNADSATLHTIGLNNIKRFEEQFSIEVCATNYEKVYLSY